MMIDVATGGARIQDVDDYYRAREVRIRQGIPEGVTYENPQADWWAWYRHWNAELPQYKDRYPATGRALRRSDSINDRSCVDHHPRQP